MNEEEEEMFVDEDVGYRRGRGRGRGRGRVRIYRSRGYGRGRGIYREEEERENRERIDFRRGRGIIRRYTYYDDYYGYDRNNIYKANYSSFIPKIELILCYPQIGKDFKISNNKSQMKLYDFKKKNLMKFEEEILFYCSSPETLKNYKSNIDDDKNYEFYNDIDSE